MKLKYLISMIITIASQLAAGADLSIHSHFGVGNSNLSSASTSHGYSAQISQSFWHINNWDLSPTLRLGRDYVLGTTTVGSRKRLDTIESYIALPGLSLSREQGLQRLAFTLLSGPGQAQLRINDSTAQSATIYELNTIRAWQSLASINYSYRVGEGVSIFSGLAWHQQDLRVGRQELSFQSQDLSTGLLSLTGGTTVPSGFTLPETIRSRSLSLEFGVNLEL